MSGEKLRTTEVAGVPVLWMPGGGKLRASLWFRAGVADETLPTRGWLQLLAHLAAPAKGQISLLHTRFDIEGEPDEVAASLRALCQWLATPDLSNLEPAIEALHDESASEDPRTVVGNHLRWRYGARGPGLAGLHEFGCHTAAAERLHELAGWAFARGNAALALSGPPPAGLELPLRPGPRVPTAPAHPMDQPLPGGFVGQKNVISLSGTVARSPAAEALVRALKRGLQGLRDESDPGDSAWASYELVDGDHAMLTAGTGVGSEDLQLALHESTALVRRLRDQGPDPAELRDDLAERIQRYGSQPADQWLPSEGARDLLLGRPVAASIDALAAETDAVTVEAVQREALEFWKNLLVSVDQETRSGPELSWTYGPPASGRTATGATFQPTGSPVAKDVLTVGPTATRLETPDRAITAWYDELAGVLAYPDGGRQLVRLDSYVVMVEPTLWRDGRQAVAIIDSSVPPWLRIPLPERSPEEIPKDPVTRIDKLRYWTNRPVVFAPLLIVLLMAVILFALQEETGKWGVWLIPILLGGGVVGYLRHRRQRS
jgi:hypothetical protein